MTNLLFLGILIFICCPISVVLVATIDDAIRNRKNDDNSNNLKISFLELFVIGLSNFLGAVSYLYYSCKEQTIFVAITYMWVGFLFSYVLQKVLKMKLMKYSLILAAISFLICITNIFNPVQNIIYIHNMKDVSIPYKITSDEINAQLNLSINNVNLFDYYTIMDPEMRYIRGEDVSVYQIKSKTEDNSKEYIPGYFIQKDGQLPEIVPVRIFYDTSFIINKDALRTVRRNYPYLVLEGPHKFDVDEDLNPYEIYLYRDKKFFYKDYGVIALNLYDGTCEKYSQVEGEFPEWIDFKSTIPR